MKAKRFWFVASLVCLIISCILLGSLAHSKEYGEMIGWFIIAVINLAMMFVRFCPGDHSHDHYRKKLEKLRKALKDAAQSLHTISRAGFIDWALEGNLVDIRGYANSREMAARAVLAEIEKEETTHGT